MKCARCLQDNPTEQKFCGVCGTPLVRLDGEAQPAPSYADVQRSLAAALEQQTATSGILRVISSSPTDVQPVFDTIASSAVRLCQARIATVFRFDGGLIHIIAHHGYTPEALALRRGLFPAPPHAGSVTGRAILNRAVIHVPDVLADRTYPYRDFARAADVRSVIAVPMLHDGRPIGVITVSRAEPGAFAERHIEVLKTFADQAMIAVETVRLVTELTETLAQQAGTGEILKIISTSPTELQPVLDAVTRSAAELCGAYDAAIFQLDGENLRVAAHRGPLHGAIGLLIPVAPGTVAGRSVLERRAIHVADLPIEAKEFPEGSAFARQSGYRTTLSIPLLQRGMAVGTIQLRRAEMNPFTDKQIALLETFASQAVIAIANVRLFEELKARTSELSQSVEKLTALGEVSRAVSSTLDVQTVFDTIVSRASQLSGAAGCSIYEYDVDTEQFELRATHNDDPEFVKALRAMPVRKGEGLIGRAAEMREPVQIPDITQPGAYESNVRDTLIRFGYRALLSVPLLREDQIIGGLFFNRKTAGDFPPEVVDILKTFANHSALAVQNASLFREIADKSAQLEERVRVRTADLRQSQQELRALSGRLLVAQETESRRIARELHDDLNQGLSLLSVEMELLGQNPPESAAQLRSRMQELIARVRQLSSSVHGLSHRLHPAKLEQLGLVAALGSLCRELTQAHGLAIDFTNDEIPELAQDSVLCLYRIAQEGLRNAIKHSRAQHVRVELRAGGGAVSLRLVDDGAGFDPRRITAKAGLGLISMRERVLHLGGEITIDSRPSKGTQIDVRLPLPVTIP